MGHASVRQTGVYATAAVLVFPKLFFPATYPTSAMLQSLATLALAFFARPLGASMFCLCKYPDVSLSQALRKMAPPLCVLKLKLTRDDCVFGLLLRRENQV